MKYYKHLDLDYHLACQKLKIYTLKNSLMLTDFWNDLDTDKVLFDIPEIQQMFNPMNITIKRISIIAARPKTIDEGIHIDHTLSNVRINLPLVNCKHSITNFYTTSMPPVKVFLPNGTPYNKIEYTSCTLVDSFCLTCPTAIRVTVPHQVVVDPNIKYRLSATIEFNENIDHLLD